MANKVTCPKCGCGEFFAQQACRGTLTVVAEVMDDGTTYFLNNDTEDGKIDPNDLDFDDPEGPFACKKCGTVVESEG